MANSIEIGVKELKTILQCCGEKACYWDHLDKKDGESTEAVRLASCCDESLCFQQLSRQCMEREICNAAMALVLLECNGCKSESNGLHHLVEHHGLCNRSPYYLLEENPSFFMGYLYAKQPGGFIIDSP